VPVVPLIPKAQEGNGPLPEAAKNGTTIVTEGGGKHSFVAADFSAIPPEVLRLLAECLGFGLRKYGRDNWKGIPMSDNIAHAMNHLNEFALGDREENHLVNALARTTFAIWQAVQAGEQPTHYTHPDMK
jgi:hypothetical protein